MAGLGKTLVISGPQGSGKSELLRRTAEWAVETGALYLGASCSPDEATLPLGVLSQLLHTMTDPAEVERMVWLVDYDGTLALPSGPVSPSPEAELAKVLHGGCQTLLDLAKHQPLLIGVDDVHYADLGSLHCLLYLARRLQSKRIMLALTETTPPRPAYSPLHAELLHHPRAHHIRLSPLSLSDITQLLGEQLPTGVVPRELARTTCEASGGNPLIVRALLTDYRFAVSPESAPHTVGLVPGEAYSHALLRCLHRSGPTARNVACGIAVLGDYATPELLGRLTGADADTIGDALHTLEASGILKGERFRTSACTTVVLGELTRAQRAALQVRAARLLHEHGQPTDVVARLLLAADDVSEPWTMATLREAAGLSLADGEEHQAVEYLKLAYRSSTDPRERAALMAQLGRIEWKYDPGLALRRFVPLTDAMRRDELVWRDGVTLLRQLLWHGRTELAQEVYDLLSERAGISQEADVALDHDDLCRWLACAYPWLVRGRASGAVPTTSLQPMTTDSPRVARPNPGLQTAPALMRVLVRGRDQYAVDSAEQVLQNSQLARDELWADEPVLFALLTLVYADETQRAAHWCDRFLKLLGTSGPPTWEALLKGLRAEIAVRLGDFPDAVDHATQALQSVSCQGWGVAIGLPLGALIMATTRMGRLDEAAERLKAPVPDAIFESRFGMHFLHARGHFHLAVGSQRAALADFLACGDTMRSWGIDSPGLVAWQTGAAQAWLAQGDRAQALRRIKGELARPCSQRMQTRGVALRLRATLTDSTSERIRMLSQSAKILEGNGSKHELSRTLDSLAHSLFTAGEQVRARLLQRRARQLSRLCGVRSEATELPSPQLRRGAPDGDPGAVSDDGGPAHTPAGISDLTEAQRRVASLAVAGHTNDQIAAKLFVTSSTVEQHLTKVYRKLRIKYRKELPTELLSSLVDTA